MAGNRQKDWGKEKNFREGQSKQVLDTLFFDYIDLAKRLQPKVVVAENVKGLILGSAYQYFRKIHESFNEAGYSMRAWLLNSSDMGVPQRRERVFVIGVRKDLAAKMNWPNITHPELDLEFNEKDVVFSDIDQGNADCKPINKSYSDLWELCKPGNNFGTVHHKGYYFGEIKVHPDEVCPTVIANQSGSHLWHYKYLRFMTDTEYSLIGSFPLDYNFMDQKPKYLIGMSVPPVMVAQIATKIYDQWLSKL